MHRLAPRVALMLAALAAASVTAADTPDPVDPTAVQAFVDDMTSEHGLERSDVETLLGDARHQQDIIDAIRSPAEALPWHRYQRIFLQDDRIKEGVAFWNENSATLDRVHDEFGVDPAVIVAIVGVETRYGQHPGQHRVLDALYTLAFDYPPRSGFFRSELAHFLLLVEEEGLDPHDIRGSYAGAMGMPQFISSSYRHYAVDGSGNGQRDLMNDTEDALASVGNYFGEHRWRPGEPVASPAHVAEGVDTQPFLGDGQRPTTTVGDLRAAGVTPEADYADDAEAVLLELDGPQGTEHWVGLYNFYVITRYNHSPLYALAAFQLAEAIRDQRGTD